MYTIHLKSISSCRLEFSAGHRKLTPYMDMLIRILQRIFSPTKIPNDATEEAAASSSSLLIFVFAIGLAPFIARATFPRRGDFTFW